MITVESVLAKVAALRSESMQAGVASPNKEQPSFAYGEICGRDEAFALVLEAISEMIEADAAEREED